MDQDKLNNWYNDNSDWIDQAWQVYYFENGGSENAKWFDVPTDDFIEDLYLKYNEEV